MIAAALSLAAGLVLWQPATQRAVAPARYAGAHGRFTHAGLLALPSGAQGPASAALGAGSSAYRVRPTAGGYRAQNPAHHLTASFGASGGSVESGGAQLALHLQGVGYGSRLRPLGKAAPAADANRVTYRHPGLSEWYVNGPLGLEQGFTLTHAPAGSPSAPLALSLALSGNAKLSLAADRHSLTLTRSGRAALRYTGLSATDARGRALHTWMALQGSTLRLLVDARGARYPLEIDPFVQQGGKLTGSGGVGIEPEAGWSVAVSGDGNTALVGAPNDNSGVGAVWVFVRSGESWTQQGSKLTPGGASGSPFFGITVSLSGDGNTALIGGSSDNGNVGAAWVFTRSGETWTQQGPKLTAAEEVGKGSFGGGEGNTGLSADGNTALIAAPGDNSVGAIYIFTRSGGIWTQQGPKLTGTEEVGNADFGGSVSLSKDGSTALVGASNDNGNVGGAWVFARSGTKWKQQGPKLTGGGEVGEGFFGHSTALGGDGNTALVGGEADNGNVGAVWVFTRSGSTWTQQGSKLTGGGEVGAGLFGISVALSADDQTALVGGPWDTPPFTGAVWVFTRSGSTWTQQGAKLTGAGETAEGEFGFSVALSADAGTAVIGGVCDNGCAGAAWTFTRTLLLLSPTEVTSSTAKTNGSVNPNGEEVTECKFEYGKTTAYGSSVPCVPSPGSGSSPVAVSGSISGLSANTTYHFRLTATTAGGSDRTSDATFTTFASSSSGSTSEPSEPAKASDGGLSVEASGGTGTITAGLYGSDPGGAQLLGGTGGGSYVDVYRSAASTFTKVEFSDCELGGAKLLFGFDPTAREGAGEWQQVSRQTYVPGSPACIKVELESSGTTPTVGQLTGYRFTSGFQAEPPEAGQCVAAPSRKEGTLTIDEGWFSSSACVSKSESTTGLPDGADEWEIATLEHSTFTTKLTTGTVVLQTAVESSKVSCTGESGSGEYAGQTSMSGVVLTFTGCTKGTQKCTSASQTAGTIVTKPLEGLLGITKLGETAAKDTAGVVLFPGIGPFSEFNCEGTSVVVRGAVILPLKADKMLLSATLKFTASKGKQKPENFVNGAKDILEESINNATYEKTGLTAAITWTNPTKVEINTVY